MFSVQTAYYDLIGMTSLMKLKNNAKFSAVPVYPIARDVCLMIYQINKEILGNTIDLDPNIKKIRHRVKLYQKKNNFKVYKRIIDTHIHQFGNDIDNLGFYLDGDQLIGSTIYSTYIFHDTQFFTYNPKKSAENAYNFMGKVGETIALIIEKLIEKSDYTLPLFAIPTFEYNDDTSYTEKDVLNSNFFVESQNQNVLLTRLVISLQEASTCIWLYNGISKANNLLLYNYILLRLLSIKADEVMDNLKNIQAFLSDDFLQVDKALNFKISSLINDFDKELCDECRCLRNMIHYNEHDINFIEYVQEKMSIDNNYVNLFTSKIVKHYMEPFCKFVSEYLKVNERKSMNDFEKITKRLLSLAKGEKFRSSKW